MDPKPYDDHPPKLPPHDGWYYPMHDAHGTLVAWLSADQLAGAISPDYQPLSRTPIEPSVAVVGASPGEPAPNPAAPSLQSALRTPQSTTSSTSPRPPDSPQSSAASALNGDAPFHALTLNDSGLSAVIEGTPDCGVV